MDDMMAFQAYFYILDDQIEMNLQNV